MPAASPFHSTGSAPRARVPEVPCGQGLFVTAIATTSNVNQGGSMNVIPQIASSAFPLVPGLHFPLEGWGDNEPQLRVKVLSTPEQRQAIAELRKHAPMGVEDDLGAGLMPFESVRDDVGFVVAFYRGAKLIATMRFVPSGHRLTAAERVRGGIGGNTEILGTGNWEVGRLIVDPQERSPEVLQRCLSLALQALIEQREVVHFYAIATPVMARLWRRFGMHPAASLCGASGRKFMLVSGHVSDVAAALEVPLTGRHAIRDVESHRDQAVALAA